MTALVQTAKGDTTAATSTSVSATFAATPTPGNLMVAVLLLPATTVPAATTPWGAPVDVSSAISGSVRTYIFSKVAGGSEPTTVTATLGSTSTGHKISLYEFSPTSGLVWAGLDKSAINQDAGVAVATLSSGTTALTTSADGVAVAGFCLSATSAGFALTNGYTSLSNPTVSPVGFTGHLVYSGNATQETTASWTTARRVAAAIATYKQATPSASSGSFLALL